MLTQHLNYDFKGPSYPFFFFSFSGLLKVNPHLLVPVDLHDKWNSLKRHFG